MHPHTSEIGAVKVVKDAVSPPTPGTDAWWRAVAAVKETVNAIRQRGLVQYVREAEGSTGQARPADKPAPYKTANCEEWRSFSAFFLVFVSSGRRRMASRLHPTPCEMNVKRNLKPTAEKTKNQRKT
jgi:hypothetical protein